MELIPKFIPKQTNNKVLEKRLININFIKNLPRETLKFEVNERQLRFNSYNDNEIISIQYPGKESKFNSKSKLIKPWDFRPKLYLHNSNTYLNDLSFGDIWNTFFDIDRKICNISDKKYLLKLLACEFYRIAFMIDYDYICPQTYKLFDIKDNTYENFNSNNGFYTYKPNQEIISILNSSLPNPLGISWESFFIYNDLLALNEDCKYYYIALNKKTISPEDYIKGGPGRINTMLTHIHIISFILDETEPADLFQSFSRKKGIAPLSFSKCNEFLSNYMYNV
ncbi:hypothetical protein [Intestinibacter bartlettii]|uniref:hypothetical protein n=1 Tax=Intestinibacter bartlettii TaxID=261299 RepID=UPI00242EF742|nr:hypothetical protein [Intestinibacter bartlettii]MDU6823646.1 hypothetical protein [Intestinibacter bartlettii]